jgi:hypothetical protein
MPRCLAPCCGAIWQIALRHPQEGETTGDPRPGDQTRPPAPVVPPLPTRSHRPATEDPGRQSRSLDVILSRSPCPYIPRHLSLATCHLPPRKPNRKNPPLHWHRRRNPSPPLPNARRPVDRQIALSLRRTRQNSTITTCAILPITGTISWGRSPVAGVARRKGVDYRRGAGVGSRHPPILLPVFRRFLPMPDVRRHTTPTAPRRRASRSHVHFRVARRALTTVRGDYK